MREHRIPVEILVVDDDEDVLGLVQSWLAGSLETVHLFEEPTRLLAHVRQSPDTPRIVLSDVRMPRLSGVDLLRLLQDSASYVVMMSAYGDVELAVQCMHLGAVTFLEKPFDRQLLSRAMLLARSVAAEDVPPTVSTDVRARMERLTRRQRDVLRRVAAGHANKRIAFDLDISIKTVEVHRANVMKGMGAESLAELVRMVVELEKLNLIEPLDP